MDVFNQFLESREAPTDWRPVALPPEERLNRFDLWLFTKLREKLDWAWAGDEVAQGRRINQARFHVERLVLDLWRRGWLLDGSKLAARILDPLEKIAKYQRAGAIHEFWPYFCATMTRYVGVNSEEIQAEALSIGATVGQLVADLGIKRGPKPVSLPELLAHRAEETANAREATLREKQRLLRAKERERAESEAQPRLF